MSIARTLNRNATDGYRAIMCEIRMDDFGNPWGTAMGWLFTLAEITYVETGETLPGFRPSPFLVVGDWATVDDTIASGVLLELLNDGVITLSDIRDVYAIMSRYENWARLAGRDY